MEESTIIYDEFISKLMNAEVDLDSDFFKAILLNPNYIPDKTQTFDDLFIKDNSVNKCFHFEIEDFNENINKGYKKGGSLVSFDKTEKKDNTLILSGGKVHFYNLTPKISESTNSFITDENGHKKENVNDMKTALVRYMIIYRVPKNNKEGILVMCQDLGEDLKLDHDDLILSWGSEPILSFTTKQAEKPKPSIRSTAILSKAILGEMRLGQK